MAKTLISQIASTLEAIENCKETGNKEWKVRHERSLKALIDCLPSGSGIDCGTKLESAQAKQIVFKAEYHMMDSDGYYDGWETFLIEVLPSFSGIEIGVKWEKTKRCADIMSDTAAYLHEVYWHHLMDKYEIEHTEDGGVKLRIVE